MLDLVGAMTDTTVSVGPVPSAHKLGLQIERLPGGHLTTNEEPEALAALIARFAMVDRRNPPSLVEEML